VGFLQTEMLQDAIASVCAAYGQVAPERVARQPAPLRYAANAALEVAAIKARTAERNAATRKALEAALHLARIYEELVHLDAGRGKDVPLSAQDEST
jgi:hypothetical protein